jgi:hypothetical protein
VIVYDYRSDPILGPVLEYWTRKRGARSMPCKRDIDPTEIPPKLLPNLQILDVIDDGARFSFRLVGTASVQALGREYTGRGPEDLLSGDRLCLVLEIYRTVCRTKSPVFSRSRYHTANDRDIFTNRIYLPLSEDGINVHHILGVLEFESGLALDNGAWAASRLDPTEQSIVPIDMGGTVAGSTAPNCLYAS